MKKQIALIALLVLPFAAGCGAVTDAKAQACTTLKGLTTNVTEVKDALKDGSTKLTVGDLKAKLKPVRDIINTVKPIAAAAGADQVVSTLGTALDGVDTALQGADDKTSLSTLADKLGIPVDQVDQAFQGVNSKLCAA